MEGSLVLEEELVPEGVADIEVEDEDGSGAEDVLLEELAGDEEDVAGRADVDVEDVDMRVVG